MTLIIKEFCDDVTLTQKLLSHEKIKAQRKKETHLKKSILFTMWSRYQENKVNSVNLKQSGKTLLIKFYFFQMSKMVLLDNIVKKLQTSFPRALPDHQVNENINV